MLRFANTFMVAVELLVFLAAAAAMAHWEVF